MNVVRWIPVALACCCWPAISRADKLPGFDDFRRVDRSRRLSGQLETEELLQVTRVNPQLILATVAKHPADWQVQWGAAELLVEWPAKQRFYELALSTSGTNEAVALRCACAAAKYRQDALAFSWLHRCQKKDAGNQAPWLVEVWLRHQALKGPDLPVEAIVTGQPPSAPTTFRDEGSFAARARIRLLELAGYSPYAARRLGFMPDLYPTVMARELASQPLAESAQPFLLGVAKAMQVAPTYLLTELVGQSLEQAALRTVSGPARAEARDRSVELDVRRDEIKELIATVGRDAVEFATEEQMVRYFDDLVTVGEQEAMLRLLQAVGKTLSR